VKGGGLKNQQEIQYSPGRKTDDKCKSRNWGKRKNLPVLLQIAGLSLIHTLTDYIIHVFRPLYVGGYPVNYEWSGIGDLSVFGHMFPSFTV